MVAQKRRLLKLKECEINISYQVTKAANNDSSCDRIDGDYLYGRGRDNIFFEGYTILWH